MSTEDETLEQLGQLGQAMTTRPTVTLPAVMASPSGVGRAEGSGGVNANGQFTYRIPIAVAPGRAGMAPHLALSYSSDGANGIAGVGWSLEGWSSITRCGKIPASGGVRSGVSMTTGPYCLDGQRLVLVGGTDGAVNAEYRTEVDSFARVTITTVSANRPLVWLVERKDGLKATYVDDDDVSVAHAVYPLFSLNDRSGNRVGWDYQAGDGSRRTGAPIPRSIYYTECSGTCPYGTAATRRIRFTYEDRPAIDTIAIYRDGIQQTISKRLTAITSEVNVGGAWQTYRDYRLTYLGGTTTTGRSLLFSVQAFDSTGGSEESTQFHYPDVAPFTTAWANGAGTYQYRGKLSGSANGMEVLAYDANGDGSADLVLREFETATAMPTGPVNEARTDKILLGDGAGYVKPPATVVWKANAESRPVGTCYAGRWGSAQPVDLDGSGQKYAVMECDFKYRLLGWNAGSGTLVERAHPDIDDLPMPWWATTVGLQPPNVPKAEGVILFTDLDGNGILDMLGVPSGTSIAETTKWQYRLASPATVTTTGSPQVSYGAWASTSIPLASPPFPTTQPGTPVGLASRPVYGVMRVLDEDLDGHGELVQLDFSNQQRSFTLSPSGAKRYGYRSDSTAGRQDGVVPGAPAAPWWDSPDFEGNNGPLGICGTWTYVDVNGDGLRDAIYRCQTLTVPGGNPAVITWNLRMNTGNGYLPAVTDLGPATATLKDYPSDLLIFCCHTVASRTQDNGIRVADMNGDGREDLILLDAPGVTRTTYAVGSTATKWKGETAPAVVLYANNTGFEAPVQLPAANGFVRLSEDRLVPGNRFPGTTIADLDGDGRPELIELMASPGSLERVLVVTRPTSRTLEKISSVSTGASAQVTRYSVKYDPLSPGSNLRNANFSSDTHLAVPRQFPAASMASGLVVRTLTGTSPGRPLSEDYTYVGGMVDAKGRGFVGFEKMTVLDKVTGIARTMTYQLTPRFDPAIPSYYYFPLRGTPVSIEQSQPLTGAGHDGALLDAVGGVAKPLISLAAEFGGLPLRMLSSTSARKGDSGSSPVLTTVTTYDSFGNAGTATTTFADTLHSRTYTSAVTTEYLNDTTNWFISHPTHSDDQRTVDTGALPSPTETGYSRTATIPSSYGYDPTTGLLTGMARGSGANVASQWNYERDAAGLLTSVTRYEPQQGASTCATSSTCAAGLQCVLGRCYASRKTSFTYDTTGTVAESATNPAGHVTWALHDPLLVQPYLLLDPNDVATLLTRDGFGRIRQMTSDTGESYSRSYEAFRVRTNWGDGAAEIVDIDNFWRPFRRSWKAFEGNVAIERTFYNPLGLVQAVGYASDSTPFENVTSGALNTIYNANPIQRYAATYDTLGRAVSSTEGTSETRTYQYPAIDSVLVTEGASSRTRTTKTDMLGRIVQLIESRQDATNLTTSYYYGPFGSLQQIQGPSSPVERFLFDVIGRPTGWNTKNLTTTGFLERERVTYNAFDEAVTVATNGIRVRYTRDALGRPLTRTPETGNDTAAQTFTWDQSPSGIGFLSKAETPGHRSEFGYNLGRPASQRETFTSGDATGTSLSFSQEYDENGQIKYLNYPEHDAADVSSAAHTMVLGDRLRYTYQNGQLSSILLMGPTQNSSLYTVNHRHPYGMVTEAVYGFGNPLPSSLSTSTWTYDPNTLRMEGQFATGISPAPIQVFDYSPTNGNLVSKTTGGFVETFGYDGATDFLRTYRRTGPASSVVDATFAVDVQGISSLTTSQSVASADWPGVNETNTFRTGADSHNYQLVTQALSPGGNRSFTYDTFGRTQTETVGSGTRTYTWNSFDLPSRIDDPVATRTFAYDAFGERAMKSQDSANRVLYVSKLFEQRKLPASSRTESVSRVFGETGVLFEVVHPWGTTNRLIRPIFTDQQGSPTFVSDHNGVTTQRGFFPYGKRMGAQPSFKFSDLGYTGHVQDDDLGLINMQGRLFDVSTRRFLTRDVVPDQPFKSFGTHPYAYVAHNPTNLFDPSGFQAKTGSSQDIAPDGCSQPGTVCVGDFVEVTVTRDRPPPVEPPPDPGFRGLGAISMVADWIGGLGQRQAAAEAGAAYEAPGSHIIGAPFAGSGGFTPQSNGESVVRPFDYTHGYDPITGLTLGPSGDPTVLAGTALGSALAGAGFAAAAGFEAAGAAVAARMAASGGAAGVKTALEGLHAGKNAGVRVVNSADELQSLFGRLSSGGKVVQGSTYPGKLVELADKTTVGLRAASRSGGPTIDIKLPAGELWKVHIQ